VSTDTRPSISALAALREGWPAELTPVLDEDGDWDGKFDYPDNEHRGEVYIECSSDGMDEAAQFAALLAAEHKATPVLLEIAKAALAWSEARDAWMVAPTGPSKARFTEAATALAETVAAKVKL
jgi:hypothetical protein